MSDRQPRRQKVPAVPLLSRVLVKRGCNKKGHPVQLTGLVVDDGPHNSGGLLLHA